MKRFIHILLLACLSISAVQAETLSFEEMLSAEQAVMISESVWETDTQKESPAR